MSSKQIEQLRTQIRLRIVLIIAGLVFSGVAAFPIEWELQLAHSWISEYRWDNLFSQWIEDAYQGVQKTNSEFPFIAYGSDWLGFAHLLIAIVFIGPLRDLFETDGLLNSGLLPAL